MQLLTFPSSDTRAMTLIELILSMVLLTAVLTAGISMEIGLRRLFVQTDLEARLLDEATPIVSLVSRDIQRGIGDASNSPFIPSSSGGWSIFSIRTDTNNNGRADAGDTWIDYRWRSANGTLRRYPVSTINSYVVLSSRVTDFGIDAPDFSLGAPQNGFSRFRMSLRMNISTNATYENPQVIIVSQAQYRSTSAR